MELNSAARVREAAVEVCMHEVSLLRLYVLRAAYLLTSVGLLLEQWPRLLQYSRYTDLWNGVGTSMLCTVSVLAALGLRYPLRMLPVLFFELIWKALWLVAVALRAARAGQLTDNLQGTVFASAIGVVVFVIAIPWRYVWRSYVMAPGDRWAQVTSR